MRLLTWRGNPIIYRGEELGLPQAHVPFSHLKDPEAIMNWPKTLGRDGARTPMPWSSAEVNAGFSNVEPWLPVDPGHAKLAVDQQQGNDSILRFTTEALSVRKAHSALLRGQMLFEDSGADSSLILRREDQRGAITAIFNFAGEPYTVPEHVDLQGDLALSSRPLKEDVIGRRVIPERAGVWVRAI